MVDNKFRDHFHPQYLRQPTTMKLTHTQTKRFITTSSVAKEGEFLILLNS